MNEAIGLTSSVQLSPQQTECEISIPVSTNVTSRNMNNSGEQNSTGTTTAEAFSTQKMTVPLSVVSSPSSSSSLSSSPSADGSATDDFYCLNSSNRTLDGSRNSDGNSILNPNSNSAPTIVVDGSEFPSFGGKDNGMIEDAVTSNVSETQTTATGTRVPNPVGKIHFTLTSSTTTATMKKKRNRSPFGSRDREDGNNTGSGSSKKKHNIFNSQSSLSANSVSNFVPSVTAVSNIVSTKSLATSNSPASGLNYNSNSLLLLTKDATATQDQDLPSSSSSGCSGFSSGDSFGSEDDSDVCFEIDKVKPMQNNRNSDLGVEVEEKVEEPPQVVVQTVAHDAVQLHEQQQQQQSECLDDENNISRNQISGPSCNDKQVILCTAGSDGNREGRQEQLNKGNSQQEQQQQSSSRASLSSAGKNQQDNSQEQQQTKVQVSQNILHIQDQPEGWRVKLYRLNSDGSWDDCGTGRIVCLFTASAAASTSADSSGNIGGVFNKRGQKAEKISSRNLDEREKGSGNGQNHNDGKELTVLEEELYQELGEPTLCMHAEIPSNSQQQQLSALQTISSNKSPKVLLRTRVLLRDAYQRQGDNIITWCEPFFSSPVPRGTQNEGFDRDDQPAGVDLALSFQDNAGCLDIWSKITNVQSKASDLFRSKGCFPVEPNTREKVSQVSEGSGVQQVGDSADEGESTQQQQLLHRHRHGGENDGGYAAGVHQHHENDGSTSARMSNGNVSDVAHAVAAAHHANLQQQQQHAMWVNVASEAAQHHLNASGSANTAVGGLQFDVDEAEEHEFREAEAAAVSMAAAAAAAYERSEGGNNGNANSNQQGLHSIGTEQQHGSQNSGNAQLPKPPTLTNLEEIADIIAAAQLQQREAIALFISQSDCAYLNSLLSLFTLADAKDDYHALATLASIIKTIVLLNDPGIIQLIVADGLVFEKCCCCLEYDPDLRYKANHQWFIKDRLKFRTVLLMEDEDLVASIHKSFRVTYLRDTLLRPTMDESSLSTLASILTFTHGEVVKGVMCSPPQSKSEHTDETAPLSQKSRDSYLVLVLRMLGREVRMIRKIEWEKMQKLNHKPMEHEIILPTAHSGLEERHKKESSTNMTNSGSSATGGSSSSSWKQHLAPQDPSLSSRKIRRRGCLCFLRELFNMVRMSLQQSDKDDFYAMIVLMDVDLFGRESTGLHLNQKLNGNTTENEKKDINEGDSSLENESVNLLSLLGAILSDPTTDVSERGACLEILSTIAMHDPSLIRKHCLNEFSTSKENGESSDKNPHPQHPVPRPQPNERRQVIFFCPPNDLLLSLLFVMTVETDAGVMLQTSELMRIILDTEIMNENSQLTGVGGVIDNEDEPLRGYGNGSFFGGVHTSGGSGEGVSELNSFLSIFYDHYVSWLVSPFQYSILISRKALPFSTAPTINNDGIYFSSQHLSKIHQEMKMGSKSRKGLLHAIPCCAIRASFSIELLSFCVRSHCYRMKSFVIRSRVLANVLKLLNSKSKQSVSSGNRCLELAALRFLRTILSVKDEHYHRHIVQNNLFLPVFDAFRANPVGDNLVSSAIIEMCDYIKHEDIKSLIEYIVTKHLCQDNTHVSATNGSPHKQIPSLEDVAIPYVDTLTELRKKHEDNVNKTSKGSLNFSIQSTNTSLDYGIDNGSPLRRPRVGMSDKALEDQRKFHETDEEESYFNDDDTEEVITHSHSRPPSPAPLSPPARAGSPIT